MSHVDEERLAAIAAGIAPSPDEELVVAHLQGCAACQSVVREYRDIVTGLSVWQQAPPEAADAVHHSVGQRIRLHHLLGEVFADPILRRQAARDPEGMLIARGITPTPQLVAAFRDLEVTASERFSGELDERIAKFWQLLG